MSKRVNVNPGQYYVGGRLKPDEMARERVKQSGERARETSKGSGPLPRPPRKKRSTK